MPERFRLRPLNQPHASRLAASDPLLPQILAAHDAAMAQGQAGYRDPDSGLLVLTARTLLDRGRCCGLGCRHCPYLL
ncbi:MAG: DUF5522 domain-containing protein [Candidatus Dormibacteria bacterium]